MWLTGAWFQWGALKDYGEDAKSRLTQRQVGCLSTNFHSSLVEGHSWGTDLQPVVRIPLDTNAENSVCMNCLQVISDVGRGIVDPR